MTHRYMVNVNDEIAKFLLKSSKKNDKSISSVIVELMNEALELREDYYLSKLAEEAEKRSEGKSPIPAEVLWKELGLM